MLLYRHVFMTVVFFFLFFSFVDLFFFFFFFQAEDGIRDKLVTGVQTCALPISFSPRKGALSRSERGHYFKIAPRPRRTSRVSAARTMAAPALSSKRRSKSGCKIGRASCRERV